MGIPETIFGTCPRCGGKGGDDPNPPATAAEYRDAGNGLKLTTYKGEVMCPLCKKELIADEETEIMDAKYREEERFRAQAGYVTTME